MRFKKQDITTVKEGLVIHGVNCQGVMGSGVAKAIKDKWPIIYEKYLDNGKGRHLLGSCHIITVNDNLYVGNCYTQFNFGPGDIPYASVDAIRDALTGAFSWASTLGVALHSPMIGCGLGGLEWANVKDIYLDLIDEFAHDNVIIYSI